MVAIASQCTQCTTQCVYSMCVCRTHCVAALLIVALHHHVAMLRLTQFVVWCTRRRGRRRVTLGLHNTGETVATACHWLPLRPTANWLARTRRVIVVALANGRAPSSDVVEFRVSQLVSRASRANNEPSLLVLRRPALRLVLARPTENH